MNNKKELSEEEFMKSYNSDDYKKPSVTVDMLIFTILNKEINNYRKLPEKKLSILLIKRGEHPFKGKWAVPGGFVLIDESLDDAAKRELKSETNIDDIYMEQLYTYGRVDRDPRTRVISCSYMALVDSSKRTLKAGDDAKEAAWFEISQRVISEEKQTDGAEDTYEKIVEITLSNEDTVLWAKIKVSECKENHKNKTSYEILENDGIAFDHAEFIEYALERLRNKIEYTDIAFNLMPDYFTLTELQKVYEIILDKDLLTAAFRRKISDMVIETDEYTKDAGHRPSKLYLFNEKWDRK